jgi:hypothetical protein
MAVVAVVCMNWGPGFREWSAISIRRINLVLMCLGKSILGWWMSFDICTVRRAAVRSRLVREG